MSAHSYAQTLNNSHSHKKTQKHSPHTHTHARTHSLSHTHSHTPHTLHHTYTQHHELNKGRARVFYQWADAWWYLHAGLRQHGGSQVADGLRLGQHILFSKVLHTVPFYIGNVPGHWLLKMCLYSSYTKGMYTAVTHCQEKLELHSKAVSRLLIKYQ